MPRRRPRNLTAEHGQRLLSPVLAAGQRGDSPQFRAYGSRANRASLRCRGIPRTIPDWDDQIRDREKRGRGGGRPPCFEASDERARHAVERFNRLKRHRALATRYDKLACRYEATAVVVAINDWLGDRRDANVRICGDVVNA